MGKAGKVLKKILARNGISQGKLAAAMDVGSSNVYRWCNEKRDPTSETVLRIIEALEKLNPDAAEDFKTLYMSDVVEDSETSEVSEDKDSENSSE